MVALETSCVGEILCIRLRENSNGSVVVTDIVEGEGEAGATTELLGFSIGLMYLDIGLKGIDARCCLGGSGEAREEDDGAGGACKFFFAAASMLEENSKAALKSSG